ncbi:MAG TPA: PAS domain S-box protein, partial [Oculatellaceae cyanobacterium]
MKIPSFPENEALRLEALRRYQILDTSAEEAFDDLTYLASYICGTPIALISLVDAHRQWFKSKVGLEASETPRELAFCAHTILQTDPLIVPNALEEDRFATNPLVTEDPNIRFYAGVPLITSDGCALGTVCAIDRIPRDLTPEQIEGLKTLSRQVVSQLELRRNLSDRKTTEAALKESQERLQGFMDNSTAAIFLKDTQCRFLFVNRQFENLFHVTNEQIQGKTDYDLFSKEIADVVRENDQKVLTSLTPLETEEVVEQEDGLHSYISVKFPLLDTQSGRPYAVCGMANDITQRKQTEQELYKLAQLQQAILDSANYAIISTDSNGIIQTFNLAAQQWLGYTAEEVVGKTTPSIFHDLNEVVQTAQTLSMELSANIEPGFEVFVAKARLGIPDKNEWTYIRKDGSRFPVRLSATAMRDDEGNIMGFLGIASDITLVKQAEAAQRESEERYQDLFENANDLIQSVSLDSKIIYVNRAWRETLGYNEAEIPKLSMLDVIHPDYQAHYMEIFGRVMSGEMVNDIEVVFISKTGREIALEGSANCKFVDSKPIATRSIFRNITKRKQAEQELRESTEIIHSLYEVTTNVQLSFDQRLQQLLEMGCQYFSLDFGIAAQVKGDFCDVFAVQSPNNEVEVGYVYDVRQTFCREILRTKQLLCISWASESEWRNHPGYTLFKRETYIGSPIWAAGQMYGILCFSSCTPIPRRFRAVDKELMRLMTQWIGGEIERNLAMELIKQVQH